MKKRTIVVEVGCTTTVAALKQRLAEIIAIEPETVSYPKGTLPDPDTIRSGVIDWPSAKVKQMKRARA